MGVVNSQAGTTNSQTGMVVGLSEKTPKRASAPTTDRESSCTVRRGVPGVRLHAVGYLAGSGTWMGTGGTEASLQSPD
eukprot:5783094-Pyramimonas_sp.AAC.1